MREHRLLRSLPPALGAVLALCGCLPLGAQSRVKFENAGEGYRIWVGKALKAVPTEPNERQTLAKWGGKFEYKGGGYRSEIDATVLLVRIKKGKGPTTGGSAPEPDAPAGGSIREQTIESLNSGTTVDEFLKKRGIKSGLVKVADEKPIRSKDRQDYVVTQLLGDSAASLPVVRSYMLESDTELFGLIALGAFTSEFRAVVEDMARSLERIQLGAADGGSSGDEFTNAGFRERVRAKLVKGWSAYDTEHFIFVTNSKNKKLIDQILIDLELMRSAYLERFPPAEGVDMEAVISAVRFCETYDDYKAYGGPDGTGGYWNFVDEELVLVDVQTLDFKAMKGYMPKEKLENLQNIKVLDVLYHEAMHQYFFYANGNLAPASWFNEGFGEVFGGAVPNRQKGEVARVDKNKFRLFWIKQCQRTGRWPDLRAFLKMSQGEFYGPSSLQNYAFAWSFCYFLEEHRQDPRGNKVWGAIPDNYLANLREATRQKRESLKIDEKNKEWLVAWTNELQQVAYEKTFADIDMDALEKAWIEAIKKYK